METFPNGVWCMILDYIPGTWFSFSLLCRKAAKIIRTERLVRLEKLIFYQLFSKHIEMELYDRYMTPVSMLPIEISVVEKKYCGKTFVYIWQNADSPIQVMIVSPIHRFWKAITYGQVKRCPDNNWTLNSFGFYGPLIRYFEILEPKALW